MICSPENWHMQVPSEDLNHRSYILFFHSEQAAAAAATAASAAIPLLGLA
jgi:hypothetical protein